MNSCNGLRYYVDETGAHRCECADCKREHEPQAHGEALYCARCDAFGLAIIDNGDTLCAACKLVL